MAGNEQAAVRVRETDLKSFCAVVLQKLEVPADEARLVSEVLIEADLRGVDSHGVIRMPMYVERLGAGGTNPRPVIRIVKETRTTAVLDGDNGLGHLVGVRAMETPPSRRLQRVIARLYQSAIAIISVLPPTSRKWRHAAR